MQQVHMQLAIQWLFDLRSGEMIEAKNYTKDYLGFDSISQIELEQIAEVLNLILESFMDYHPVYMISDSMGELVVLRSKAK